MPTYIYRCTDCGHEFEEFQSITDKPIDVCPQCQGHPERIITGGAGFLFKGEGFYITDHRSKKYRDDAARDRSSSVAPPSKTSGGKASSDTRGKGSSKSHRTQGR